MKNAEPGQVVRFMFGLRWRTGTVMRVMRGLGESGGDIARVSSSMDGEESCIDVRVEKLRLSRAGEGESFGEADRHNFSVLDVVQKTVEEIRWSRPGDLCVDPVVMQWLRWRVADGWEKGVWEGLENKNADEAVRQYAVACIALYDKALEDAP